MTYDTLASLASGEINADGKVIKIRAELGAYYNFKTNGYTTVIEKYDATSCCAVYYEVRFPDDITLPPLGSEILISGTAHGVGESGYIDVNTLDTVSLSATVTDVDIDTVAFTAEELAEFIEACAVDNNEYIGKTVRICGGYESSYLLRYYHDTQKDKYLANKHALLHSDTLEFPEVDPRYMNCYEIVGVIEAPHHEISDGVAYDHPRINVTRILPINQYTVE